MSLTSDILLVYNNFAFWAKALLKGYPITPCLGTGLFQLLGSWALAL